MMISIKINIPNSTQHVYTRFISPVLTPIITSSDIALLFSLFVSLKTVSPINIQFFSLFVLLI